MKVYKYCNGGGSCCHKGRTQGGNMCSQKIRCVKNGCPFLVDCLVDTDSVQEVNDNG